MWTRRSWRITIGRRPSCGPTSSWPLPWARRARTSRTRWPGNAPRRDPRGLPAGGCSRRSGMAGTERIGKAAEEKIISALGDAKDLMNEGLQPNEAIIKAAELHELPAGHIRLMVQAYNTAQ